MTESDTAPIKPICIETQNDKDTCHFLDLNHNENSMKYLLRTPSLPQRRPRGSTSRVVDEFSLDILAWC